MKCLHVALVACLGAVPGAAQPEGPVPNPLLVDMMVKPDLGPFIPQTGASGTNCIDVPLTAGPHAVRLKITVNQPSACVGLILGDQCAPMTLSLSPTFPCFVDVSNPLVAAACFLPPPLGGPAYVTPNMANGSITLLFSILTGPATSFCIQAFAIKGSDVCTSQAFCFQSGATCGPGTPNGPTSDDGFVNWAFSGADADFAFYGVTYTDVFVNSNGSVTFGAGDGDFTESDGEMSGGAPRIAPGWDDLSPNQAGSGPVGIDETDTEVTVSWFDVQGFASSGTARVCATLDKASGTVRLGYMENGLWNGAVAARNVICGISPGGGAGKAALDLGQFGLRFASPGDGIWQWLNDVDGPFDLDFNSFRFLIDTGPNHYFHQNP